jgi:hypothetical protein
MRKFILSVILIILLPILSYTQTPIKSDSLRINEIDKTLQEYGKQQTISNKITIVSVITIGIGTIIGIPAGPLLIVNTIADLTTILISSKSNKRLSKHATDTKAIEGNKTDTIGNPHEQPIQQQR